MILLLKVKQKFLKCFYYNTIFIIIQLKYCHDTINIIVVLAYAFEFFALIEPIDEIKL